MKKYAKEDMSAFTFKLPKYLWVFLKQCSLDQCKTMGSILIDCIETYKKKMDKSAIRLNEKLVGSENDISK